MSEGPIITGRVRLKDETGATLDSIQSNVTSSFKDIASVAGGIITAEFSRNVVGALEDVGRSSVEQAAAFESATARIIAASGLTGKEAQDLSEILQEAAKSLGVEFGTGATGAMEALESLVKAGLDPATEATAALQGVMQLATIEGMNTAAAADMVVQAMTMYGVSAEEATRVVDGFVKASAAGIDTASGYAVGLGNVGATAANMGLSLEETLATLVQLDNTFGGAQESGTFLNRMLLDMAKKAEDAGLSLYNVDGSMKSLDEIMGQVREKLQGFGDDQAAANEWLGQFDSRAQKAIIALANYDETISETQTGLGDMAGAQEQVNVIMDTYAGEMSKVQAQQELNNIEIGKTTTQLSLMSAEFMASLGPIGNVASALGPSMLSGAMQGLTATYLPMLIGNLVGGGGLTAAFSSVGGMIPGLGSLIGMAGPVGIAIVAIGAGVALFAAAWKNNWFGIRDITKNVTDAIGGFLKGLMNSIKKAIERLKDLFRWKKKATGGGERGTGGGAGEETGEAGGAGELPALPEGLWGGTEGEEPTGGVGAGAGGGEGGRVWTGEMGAEEPGWVLRHQEERARAYREWKRAGGIGRFQYPFMWGWTSTKGWWWEAISAQSGLHGVLKEDIMIKAHKGEEVHISRAGESFPGGPFGYTPGIQWSRYGYWDVFGRWVREDRPGITRRGGARTYAETILPATQAQGGITIHGPLLVVQGNADRRTMQWAVNEVFKRLKTVTVEPSSSGAATKRIRTGSRFGGVP